MTVLSESTQRIPTGTGWIFVPFALIALIITIVLLLDEYYKSGLVFLAITIALFVVMVDFGTEPHRRIKALISDDYPAVELLDKYTVDGNDGEIWMLIEREPMDEKGDEG